MTNFKRTTRDDLERLGTRVHEIGNQGETSRTRGYHVVDVERHLFVEIASPAALSHVTYVDAPLGRDRWYYGTLGSLEESREAMRKGAAPESAFEMYLKMREKMQPIVDRYAGMGVSTRRRRVRREHGDELNMDRAMIGDPACWDTRVRGRRQQCVKLGVQFGYTASASTSDIVRGAAMGAAASDVLTRLGYAVEILGISWGTYGRRGTTPEEHVLTVNVKDANAPIDPRNLLILGLPAMSRVFEFGVWDAFKGVGGMVMPPLSQAAMEEIGLTAFVGSEFKVVNEANFNYDPALMGFSAELAEIW